MSVNNAKNRQGAVRKKQKAPRRPLAWRAIFQKTKLLLLLAGVVAVVAYVGTAVFKQTQSLLTTPISAVEVQGVLQYQDKQSIKKIVNKYAAEGFLQTNLKELQHDLMALPWIAKAIIKRKPNNALELVLEEEKVVAMFNDTSLVNQYGQLITPKQLPQDNSLMRLYGSSYEKALAVLLNIQPYFEKQQQKIIALHLKGNKSVSVQLENDVWVSLHEDAVEQQMQRFVKVLEQGLKGNLADVSSIDLRYKNGAAVAWKKASMAYLGTR